MRTEVDIQKVGQQGQGVGYDPTGNIYFVPGAVPGDRVRVEFAPSAKKYRDAELVEVVQQSPDRTTPPCPYFNSCGGCDWLHWTYAAQVSAKDMILRHTLERGQLVPRHWLPFARAEQTFGYRNRIQVRRDANSLGFMRRKTNEIVDVERCLVAHPALNEELAAIRREPPPPAGAPAQKIELFLSSSGRVLRVQDMPHGAAGFAQVNEAQNETLKKIVSDMVVASKSKQVLELYCGNGNLTFAFAPHVEHTIAFDSNENALESARLRRDADKAPDDIAQAPSRTAFVNAMIDRALLRKLPPDFRGQYDTLVLDPPRSGLGPSWSISFTRT